MTTEKQTKANKENAQLSTGAKSSEGKLVVSKNAVKHGVFTRDLIIQAGDGKEDPQEYQEILVNLVQCLEPEGQMESLLVEKIAVDFWRLRRVIRFETGSIRNFLDTVIEKYYTPSEFEFVEDKTPKTKSEIDEAIADRKRLVDWNIAYIKCLKKGMVKFDKQTWEGADLEADIEEDFAMILDEFETDLMDQGQITRYEAGELDFNEMKTILFKNGYTDKKLAEVLLPIYEKQIQEYQLDIYKYEREKQKNIWAEEVRVKVNSLPTGDNADKVMRYERSLQKSVFQNLAVLKQLQAERSKE